LDYNNKPKGVAVMKISFLRFWMWLGLLWGGGAFGMASGSQVAEPMPGESVAQAVDAELKERVKARWEALIRRDFQTAYQFETPSFREAYSVQAFGGKFGDRILWTSAETTEVKFEGSKAQVTVRVAYKALLPNMPTPIVNGVRYLQETWVQEGRDWFHETR